MKVYKKLFSYVPHDMATGYFAIIVSCVSAAVMVYGYYFLYQFLREVLIAENPANASSLAVRILLCLTLSALLYFVSGLFSHMFAFRLETRLRKRGIDGLMDASFRFFDLNSSGYVRKTIDDNAAKTHSAVAHMLPDNAQAVLVPLLSIILAFVLSLRVGLVTLLLALVCGLILKGMMGKADFMKLYQASLDKLSSETVEYVRGMQVVKIFGTRLQSFKALYKAIVDYSKYAYNYSLSCKKAYVLYQWIFLGLIPILAIPLSFFLPQFREPRQILLDLIMIFFFSGIIMVYFMKIMWASMNIFNANYAVDSLETLFAKMQTDKLSYGQRERFPNYTIDFEHVSFAYNTNQVFDDLSFSLEENKVYALVGPSGSGKSTLAKLLSGFYKVDQGAIKIGGHPLEEYSQEALTAAISFVFQDSMLFKKSIYENVALADPKASRAEVLEAMEQAGCADILAKFKYGENTVIGSKGVYLSGGEKQRIAIARAILKNAPIIIMDEASASIDADNEYELQKAFKNLMKGKTTIMIAHRLSSVQAVDEILVMEDGKIVERGKGRQLLEKEGVYSRLFHLYKRANDWRVSHETTL